MVYLILILLLRALFAKLDSHYYLAIEDWQPALIIYIGSITHPDEVRTDENYYEQIARDFPVKGVGSFRKIRT